LIFKKDSIKDAIEFAKEIKQRGYKIFLNPVSLTSYHDSEILELLSAINELKPEAVSIVDTYGLMYGNDIRRYVYLIDGNLNHETALGYHSHNNIQMANANCIEFINMNLQRNIIVDSSILGMGKNAGNACTEFVVSYAEKVGLKQLDLDQVLECAYTDIQKFRGKQAWGYHLEFLISAISNCSPNWPNYLMGKNTLSIKNIRSIISTLPYEGRLISYYSKELAEQKYLEFMDHSVDDTEYVNSLRDEIENRQILLLCPGNSLKTQHEKIDEYIKTNHPIVITVNFVADIFTVDYTFISNSKRYSQILGEYPELCTKPKIMLTSNIVAANSIPAYMVFNYKTHYDKIKGDNSAVILLSLLQDIGIRSVFVAGLDGYDETNTKNDYYEAGLQLPPASGGNQWLVEQLRHVLSGDRAVTLNWITSSRIESMVK
jgi:4-hydroxy 2-oxovalerate aldolase